MKRGVYLLMLLAMAVSGVAMAVTACAPQPTEAPAAAETPQIEEPAPTPAQGTVEIEFWYGLGGKLGEVVQDFIKRFNEAQNEVHVTGVVMPDYDTTLQKLQAAIAAKNPPAIALISGSRIQDLIVPGVLRPYDDLIAADPDFHPEDIPEAFFNLGLHEGKHYGIPLYGTTQILYCRKDFFEELGISPDMLNTYQGLAEAARQCRVVENGEVVRWGWEPMWEAGSSNMVDAALSNGGKILSDDGKQVLINSPEWVEVWEAFRTWLHEEKIMRIHYGGEGWAYWYDTIDDVMQGRACGYTGSSGDQGDLDFSIIAGHIQPGWGDHPPAPRALAHQAVIPLGVSDEQAQAAYKMIKFFTSTDMTAEWSTRTGYIAVRLSAQNSPVLKEAAQTTMPAITVPLEQLKFAQPDFIDPTGGKIWDAMVKAGDRVQIEGIAAKQALDEAAAEAQAALDEYWASKGQ